ncbi:OsmC family protein [Mesorhizobium sp. M0119]|uniref:OsmC family protein n=1 Tax=Mesorhizobium sp. M0119 TaxID=2956885 RepID=UPI0033356711
MDITTFRATQEPIKDLYRKDARAALLTLKAKGSADDSKVTCKVETGRGLALAGIHPKAGGSGQELCSGDMLLEALVACAGVSMRAAAAVLEIPIKSAEISAEGDVDLRGTLGVTEGVPVGFKEIRLRFDIETDVAQDRLTDLLELTDRYCVIFQTIQRSPKTFVKLHKIVR